MNAGEPVFAPDPDRGLNQGWLIVQTLDTARGSSAFAVLDTGDLAGGGETMPISFHGHWVAARN